MFAGREDARVAKRSRVKEYLLRLGWELPAALVFVVWPLVAGFLIYRLGITELPLVWFLFALPVGAAAGYALDKAVVIYRGWILYWGYIVLVTFLIACLWSGGWAPLISGHSMAQFVSDAQAVLTHEVSQELEATGFVGMVEKAGLYLSRTSASLRFLPRMLKASVNPAWVDRVSDEDIYTLMNAGLLSPWAISAGMLWMGLALYALMDVCYELSRTYQDRIEEINRESTTRRGWPENKWARMAWRRIQQAHLNTKERMDEWFLRK